MMSDHPHTFHYLLREFEFSFSMFPHSTRVLHSQKSFNSFSSSLSENIRIPFNRIETIYIKLIHFLFEIFTVSNGFPNTVPIGVGGRKICEMKILQQLKCSSRKTSIKSELSEKFFSLFSINFIIVCRYSSYKLAALQSNEFHQFSEN